MIFWKSSSKEASQTLLTSGNISLQMHIHKTHTHFSLKMSTPSQQPLQPQENSYSTIKSKTQAGSSSFNHDKYPLPLNHIRVTFKRWAERRKEDSLKSSALKRHLQKSRRRQTTDTLTETKDKILGQGAPRTIIKRPVGRSSKEGRRRKNGAPVTRDYVKVQLQILLKQWISHRAKKAL